MQLNTLSIAVTPTIPSVTYVLQTQEMQTYITTNTQRVITNKSTTAA